MGGEILDLSWFPIVVLIKCVIRKESKIIVRQCFFTMKTTYAYLLVSCPIIHQGES